MNSVQEQRAAPTRITISGRESEVLNLIAQGMRSQDAAESLFLSKRTVDYHLLNVYQKLGVHNRISAILQASRMGLVPFDPIQVWEAGKLPNSMSPQAVGRSAVSHELVR